MDHYYKRLLKNIFGNSYLLETGEASSLSVNPNNGGDALYGNSYLLETGEAFSSSLNPNNGGDAYSLFCSC